MSLLVTLCKWPSLNGSTSYTFAIGTTSAAIYSVLEPIEKDTSLTLGDLNAGTGYMVSKSTVEYSAKLKSDSSCFLGGVAFFGNPWPYNTGSAQSF